MRAQEINCYAMNTSTIRFDRPNAFSVRKDRPLVWLQRLCCWLLSKLGAHDIGEELKIEHHIVDGDELMERIFKHYTGIEEAFKRRPTKLYMGSEDYAKLMRESVATMPFSLEGRYGRGREVFGLQIEVVPWMRGILAV